MRSADQDPSSRSRPVAVSAIVETELETVLNSRMFKSAGSLRELLRFTVQETVAGRGGDLKEYLLGTTVLRKGDSFDPKADPIVRVQMRRLRQRLEHYYATDGRSAPLIIEIPKGAYTPIFRTAAAAGAVPAPAAGAATLVVGRRDELAALQAAFESASAGNGRMLCLSGEAGIGKTTVVETFLRELSVSGAACQIGRGRCSERLSGSEAYLSILEALDSLVQQGDQPLRNLLSRVAPHWYVQIARPAEGDAVNRISAENALASQQRLKRELMTFLSEFARREPVILFLDDLHWADVSTVDMLAYVAPRSRAERMLIVGTYRPADLLVTNHSFLRAKLELQVHGVCQDVAMSFLAREEVDRYLSLQFSGHRFPADLGARLHHRTEGNPLFMADVVRLLRDRDVLVERDGRWVMSGDLAEVEQSLPESVRSLIEKKNRELSDFDRRLLTVAAVQGHEFDSVVVARALEIDAADAEERLEWLDRTHGFIRLLGDRELPDSTLTLTYAFTHVLYHDVLFDALTATRKTSVSHAVARALVEFYGDQSSQVASQLAILFEAGRDFTRASDFFLVAARNAARVYAAREAVALADRAVAAARKVEGREQLSRVMAARLLSATQHECLTELPEAVADYEAAERAAEDIGDRETQIHAIYRKSVIPLFFLKRLSDVRNEGRRAMELAHAAQSATGAASSDVILGIERWCAGDIPAATHHVDRAIPVFRKHDPFNQAPLVMMIRGGMHTFALEHDQADEMLEWGRTRIGASDAGFVLGALFYQGRSCGNRGRLSDASEKLEEGLRLAELLGDRFWLPRVANTRGWILSELCDTENALRVNTEAVRMAQEIGDIEAECMARINAARDCMTLGDMHTAWDHLQQATVRCEQDRWFRWVYFPRLQAEAASYWITQGDLRQALSCAQSSLEDAERTSSRKRMAWAHGLLAEIAVQQDRMNDARREFDAALQILAEYACPTIEWRILRRAAQAAAIAGDTAGRAALTARAGAVVRSLADGIRSDTARATFLQSEAVRELVT